MWSWFLFALVAFLVALVVLLVAALEHADDTIRALQSELYDASRAASHARDRRDRFRLIFVRRFRWRMRFFEARQLLEDVVGWKGVVTLDVYNARVERAKAALRHWASLQPTRGRR